jgi:hypothetical protein
MGIAGAIMAVLLVAVTFAMRILVALNEARKHRRNRDTRMRQEADAATVPAHEAA